MLGVDRSTALVWLVFFRVFYYLVPLAFGALLFVYHFCQKINRFFKGLPNLIWHQSAHVLITVFMYFSGILMLIDASLPDLTENSRFLQRFYPFAFFFLHQLSTVLFAIAMLACARGVQAKLKKAYWPSLILLLIGMVNTLWNLGTWGLTIYLLILLLLVLTMRHALYREKMAYSLGKAFSDGIVFVGIFILYIIVVPTADARDTFAHSCLKPNNFPHSVRKMWKDFVNFSGGSYMIQDTDLFHDSIADNIRIGKLDATQAEIEAAARKAALHDFILTLPHGYDTPVGELGDTLSGGERQRIGLARAFLHEAPFLLLDEPTSNLDSLNEGIILRALREEQDDRTVILVSHRTLTLSIAQQSYAVDCGRLC